jgi:glycosyltransferase involved in cell wall biosynthesis
LCLPQTVPLISHLRDTRAPVAAVRRAVARAAAVIVVSDYTASVWRDQLPAELHDRLQVVYNGFDVDALIAQAAAGAAPVAAAGPLAVLVADLVPWKQHALFLDALALARSRQPQLHGLIVGGPRDEAGAVYMAELQARAAAPDLAGAVTFSGHLASALPAIAAADVVLSTADGEPFGRTIVEALALGRAIVCTPGGGPAEIVGDRPLARTAAAAEPQAVADAVCDQLAEPPSAADRAAGVARARDFSLTAHASAMLAVFDTAAR